ncbi:MAG: radical SAM protein [Candidatus Thorarchaeota archaeon]
MIVEQIIAKSIITKSNIPGIDFVINPYIGCQHSCIYCYAEFMKRFTGHSGDKWGEFLDVKNYDWDKIKPEKYSGKTLLLSSVTDPYTPLEIKFENTRRVLEKLIGTQASVSILTKSSLVTRDIDLFKQFEDIRVGISINSLDEDFVRVIEPRASKPRERIEALRTVSEAGIPTYVFISPIFPRISDWRAIIDAADPITDDFRFENLNFRGHNVVRIRNIVTSRYPELSEYYEQVRRYPSIWNEIEDDIEEYCKQKQVRCKIEFHHGGFSKGS